MKKVFQAVIVAAGSSTRMGGKQSKILTTLYGKPVIWWTLQAFEKADAVKGITVVCRKEDCPALQKLTAGFLKEVRLAEGGEDRQASVYNGVMASPAGEYLVIHDGARPLITPDVIDRLCETALAHKALTASVKAKDTCKLSDQDGFVAETLNREAVAQIQTPQIFCKETYLAAYDKAMEAGKRFTDDCQLVEHAGEPVFLAQGNYQNIKITTPEDLTVAEAFLKERTKAMRIGYGYDVHKLTEGRKLILGGMEIPHEKGLLGHSDADVLLHAVSDALLGAAALGDIGRLFPDTDPAYKNADSLVLLTQVAGKLQEKGYTIGNIDATVAAQAPRLAPYIDGMRDKIAAACCIDRGAVSVKATTEEGLGFTGRKEGISASAVCLLL